MSDEILKKLQEFIVRKRWEYDFPLTRDKLLETDLGMYGDDADEFLIAFGAEFSVDVTNFSTDKYFSPEGSVLPALIRIFNKKPKAKELTIGDLEKAVIAGKLDEELLNKNI